MINGIINLLEPNMKLIVNRVGDGGFYDSRLEEPTNKNILISMPTNKGKPIQVNKGSVLNISVITSRGRLSFDSKVEGIKSEPIYMLIMSLPTAIRHEQMRQFYRMSTHIDVKIFIGSSKDLTKAEKHSDPIEWHKAVVDNISGGGCRVTTNANVSASNALIIDFSDSKLPDLNAISCHVIKIEIGQTEKSYIRLKYNEIEDITQNKIVRYVFRRQMELRDITKQDT